MKKILVLAFISVVSSSFADDIVGVQNRGDSVVIKNDTSAMLYVSPVSGDTCHLTGATPLNIPANKSVTLTQYNGPCHMSMAFIANQYPAVNVSADFGTTTNSGEPTGYYIWNNFTASNEHASGKYNNLAVPPTLSIEYLGVGQ